MGVGWSPVYVRDPAQGPTRLDRFADASMTGFNARVNSMVLCVETIDDVLREETWGVCGWWRKDSASGPDCSLFVWSWCAPSRDHPTCKSARTVRSSDRQAGMEGRVGGGNHGLPSKIQCCMGHG